MQFLVNEKHASLLGYLIKMIPYETVIHVK